jgi:uncharacterized membrane protein (DUF373 family)
MDPIDILKKYEKIVYLILIFLFAVIVAFSIGELVFLLFGALFVNSPGLLEDNELLGLIGYFLLVLIGVEILATISVFIKDNVIHVETVIVVAIIAIARGVILFEPSSPGANALNMFGTAAIIIALCSGYYLLKKGGIQNQ